MVRFPSQENLAELARDRGWEYREILPPSIQVSHGARALGEDFLRWAEHGQDLLRVHRDAVRGREFGRFWASYLHSVQRYPMDAVFRCTVPGATVIQHGGGVLSDRHEVLPEAFFISNLLRKSDLQNASHKPLPGKYVSLLTIWGDRNLGHFFFDAILRTAVFDDLSGYQFLVPAVLHPWHMGLLELAGISPDKLVPVRVRSVVVEELEVARISRAGSMPRQELLLAFRERARRAAGVKAGLKPFRRLFVDRSLAKRRKLLNQASLENVLSDRGFELIRWEEYSIHDQVRIASEASMIAGPHGTNLLNSIYSAPGAKLLEIVNPRWWDAATLRQATLIGHEFWYCFGEDASPDHDLTIDPKKLAKVLDYMLDAPVCEEPPEKTGKPVKTF